MRNLILSLAILTAVSCNRKSGWKHLFDGSSLDNFEILNGTAEYYIDNGNIVGVSKMNTPNTFLCTTKKYKDFILEFEVWADTSLNSGVQFRSICDPNIKGGVMHGYQVEIESSPRKWAGGIYDESRRGWLYPLSENEKGQTAFVPSEWNKYRIEAIGSSIRTWINGIQCANLIDDMTSEGIIGMQVHAIGKKSEARKEIRWKNIRIITDKLQKHSVPSENYAPIIDTSNKGL